MFQWKAKNLHGIHPPFVYQLLDEVVYQNRKIHLFLNQPSQQKKLYLRLLKYFDVKSVFLLNPDSFFTSILNEYQKTSAELFIKYGQREIENKNIFDIIILNNIQNHDLALNFIKIKPFHNDTIVIIPQIRASKEQLKFWKAFSQNEEAVVCLEFYDFAWGFFRKESSKQYFSIKY